MPVKLAKIVILSVSMALLSACPQTEEASKRKAAERASANLLGSIQAVYHGLPLDKEGQLIEYDQDIIAKSLFGFVNENREKADIEGLSQIDAFKERLTSEKMLDPQLELALTGAQAEYIATLDPRYAPGEMPSKISFLREELKRFPSEKDRWFDERGMRQLRELSREYEILLPKRFWEILIPWWRYPLRPLQFRYCAINNVPQPPDWGTAGWVRRSQGAVNTVPPGNLYILNTPGYVTEVWTHTDPGGKGGCIALPRKNGGNTTLGVICQNANTGKACFWDNRPHSGGNKFSDAEMTSTKKSIVNDWVNGNDAALSGGGKCVQCHRGENAFLLHQNTLLSNNPAMPFDTGSAIWYSMVNSLGWTNPPKTTFATGSGCTTCHDIGSTTDAEKSNYCSILKKASNAEMPDVTNPASWNPAAGSAYKAHIDEMKANGCPP